MLKIIDEYELKGLEKLGYKNNGKLYYKYKQKPCSFDFSNIKICADRTIWLGNRNADRLKRATGWVKEELDKLKALGIVEKVEE